MEVTRQSLAEYYRGLSDDELQRMLASEELTPLAGEVAGEELRQRGIEIAAPAAADAAPALADQPMAVELAAAEAEDEPEGTDPIAHLTLLARYLSGIEAEIVRGRLESEGILAFVADAHAVRMMSLFSFALGGVRVLVRQFEIPLACEILRSV